MRLTEKELNEQKKEYLNSYKNLCRKLQSLEEQLQSLKEIGQTAKIQELSDMPRGNKQQDLSDYMVMVDELERKIQSKRENCIERKLEIEACIANVENGIESMILHKRYIKLKPWEQICIEVNYGWRQTHKIHSRALANFKSA